LSSRLLVVAAARFRNSFGTGLWYTIPRRYGLISSSNTWFEDEAHRDYQHESKTLILLCLLHD